MPIFESTFGGQKKRYNIPVDKVEEFKGKRPDAVEIASKPGPIQTIGFGVRRAGEITRIGAEPVGKENIINEGVQQSAEKPGERTRRGIAEYESALKKADALLKNPSLTPEQKQDVLYRFKIAYGTLNPEDHPEITQDARAYLEQEGAGDVASQWKSLGNAFSLDRGVDIQGRLKDLGAGLGLTQDPATMIRERSRVKNYLGKTAAGQRDVRAEQEYLAHLDRLEKELEEKIRVFEKEKIAGLRSKNDDAEMIQASVGAMPFGSHSEEDRKSVPVSESYEKDAAVLETAKRELKKVRQMRERAFDAENKSRLDQMLGEIYRRGGDTISDAVSLGSRRTLAEKEKNLALKDGENNIAREASELAMETDRMLAHKITVGQAVAGGAMESVPYMAEFAATRGVAKLLKPATAARIAELGSKGGLKAAAKIAYHNANLAATMTALQPSTYARAYEMANEDAVVNGTPAGGGLDFLGKAVAVQFITNASESAGDVFESLRVKKAAGKLSRWKNVRKQVANVTGVHGIPSEFMEEKTEEVGQALTGVGDTTWADVINPRRNIITLGTVAFSQLPVQTITAMGYTAGKANNAITIRNIRKGYNRNVSNMIDVFGDESKEAMETVEALVASYGDSQDAVRAFDQAILESDEYTDAEKSAMLSYAMSYAPMVGVDKEVRERADGYVAKATGAIEQSVNKDMDAVVTIRMDKNAAVLVGGKIVQKEGGSIDKDNSDKTLYYRDENGEVHPIGLDAVDEVIESVPRADALQQVSDAVSENVVKSTANAQSVQRAVGEEVAFVVDGTSAVGVGVVQAMDDAGNYVVAMPDGSVSTIEPRQLVDEEVARMENGSTILYTDADGTKRKGVVADSFNYQGEGLIVLEDGTKVPFVSILGVLENENQDAVVAPIEEIPAERPTPEAEETPVPQEEEVDVYADFPKRKNGEIDSDKLTDEQALIYAEREHGEEFAVESAQAAIDALNKKRGEVSDKMNAEGSVAKRADMQSQIKIIDKRIGVYQEYLKNREKVQDLAPSEETVTDVKKEDVQKNIPKAEQDVRLDESYKELEEKVNRLSELFHTPVRLHYSPETIQNVKARKAAEDGLAKGWYVDGEVHIYLPNATGVEDIQETFFHEVVAHKGVKDMLGDKHSELMEALFDIIPESEQNRLLDLYGEKHIAADEYLAELAERGGFKSEESRGIISKIVDAIREFLSRYHIQISSPTAEEIANSLLKESAARLTEKRKEADAPAFNGDILAYARDLHKRNQLRETAKGVEKNPSVAQQEAGNYKKGHVNVQGFDITIENPKGSTRRGVDESGKEWSITMQNDYGYFKRSEGKDGDQIDVFIGNNPETGKIFVVDQINPEMGVFDESKVMLGFNSEEEARSAYLSNYEEGWQGLGSITGTDTKYFKEWLYDGKKQRKAFSEYKDVAMKNKPRKTLREIIDSANERAAKEKEHGWFESVMSEQQLPEERTKSNIKGIPEEFVGDDKNRPVLTGVYHSNGMISASDGLILISEEKKYPKKDEGLIKSENGIIDGKYPSVEKVIPNMDVYSEFDAGSLVSFVERAETAIKSEWSKKDGYGKRIDPRTYKVKRSNTYVVLRINGRDFVIRFDQLDKMAKAAKRLGINKIGGDVGRIHITGGNNHLVASSIEPLAFLKEFPGETVFAYDLTGEAKFRLVGGNSGYVGYSMSKRAAASRSEGRYPKTDFKKEYGVSEKTLQALVDADVVSNSEWHHTSKYGNKTTFYSWNGRYYHDVYLENKDDVLKLVEDGKDDELFDLFDKGNEAKTEEWRNSLSNRVLEAKREIMSKYHEYAKEVRQKLADVNYTASDGSIVIPDGKIDHLSMDVEKDGVRLTKRNGKRERDNARREYFDYVNSRIMPESEWSEQNKDFVNSVLSKYRVSESDIKSDAADYTGDGDVRFRGVSVNDRFIKEQAIADGTFMKAPNGQPTKLNERQWLQVRTSAFKNWFGDWEKSARIGKLRKAKPVEITGKEVKPSDDLKQYKKNASEYGKTLQGLYVNKDTGKEIQLQRGRKNGGINEVLQHDYKNAEHLQSIAAIPAIIENSVYIDTQDNTDLFKNPGVREYQYYVCGLKIGSEDYTVRATIAVDNKGDRYYDHKLTQVEKGKLLDLIENQAALNNGFGATPDTKSTTTFSGYKDTKLVSLLQNDSSKVVDENGEPLVVYHGTNNDKTIRIWDDKTKTYDIRHEPFTVFKRVNEGEKNRGHFFNSNADNAGGYGYNTYDVFLSLKHPLVIDAHGDNYSGVKHRGEEKDTYEWAEYAESKGYDGVVFLNISDGVGYGDLQNTTNDYVSFNSSQIKSATDNTGMFNSDNNDIRFRMSDIERLDEEYKEVVERGDMDTTRQMLLDQAGRNGYNTDSSYQGTSAFNGVAPSDPGFYKTHEEKVAAFEDGEHEGEWSLGDELIRGIKKGELEHRISAREHIRADNMRKEAIQNLRYVRDRVRNGENDVTITIYRSVPVGIEETELRNGDWVTPSRSYAEGNASVHEGIPDWENGYRIIEQDVPIDHLWWDGNDIAEWGYDNGKEEVYKNTIYNRKSLEVTYDENGVLIPLSKRFDDTNSDIRFRITDGPIIDTEDLKNGIRRENRFQRTMDKFYEAYQDTYLPVKRLYERIAAQGVKVEDWENFYAQATHIPGKNQAEIEVYTSKYMNPMIEQVKALQDKGLSFREIENYVMLKHGMERNEYMRDRESAKYLKKHPRATAAKVDELKSKDYAGVRDIAREVGGLDDIPEIGTAEGIAEEFVRDIEAKCGNESIGSFWDAVTAATRFSLTKSYHSGILSKDGYDELISRYKYYVPLRGHDAITAEDKWDYISESGSPTFSSPIKKAKGRSTRAESPFAFIFQTAQSSIMAGNKNRLKSTLLNLAESGKAGTLFNISRAWYEKAGTDEQGNDAWQLAIPKYDDDPVVYAENIASFEERMKEESKKGNAVHGRRKLDLDGMFIKPSQAAEHEIHIRRNGEDLVMYVNADPALARSVNGTNRVMSDSRFMHGARWSTRQIAAMSTSLNPLFTASNFMRDLQYSVMKLGAEKGGVFTAGYSVRLGRILFKDKVLVRMLNGQLDLSKKYDQYAYEFLMNGGKTGYVSALNLETTAHRIEKELKRLGVRELSALNPAKEAYLASKCARAVGDFFVMSNEITENSIRLAAYITSRESGESIINSVNTAKEVTVNFNRRGSGAMGADIVNSLFMFTNVAFQALDNFAKIAMRHKWKIAAVMATYMLSGLLQSWWIDEWGSDDSKEAYWGTSDWDRQNNLCVPVGRGLLKIPHPQELRALRGLGVGIYQSIKGTKSPEDTVLDLLSAVADVVPMGSTFVPSEASVSGVATAASPTVLQPVTQWVTNINFKGSPVRNAYAPEYAPGHLQARTNRKGEPRADKWIYDLCEFINVSVGRGDGAKKGWIDLNPDAVQHFAGGYFGGLFSTASGTVNTIYMAKSYDDARGLRIRDTPLRRFYAETADMNNVDSGTMSKYYDLSKKADQAHYMFGRYKKQLQDKSLTPEDYREKIEELNYPYWKSIRDELSAIRRLERRLKDVAEDEQVKLDMKSAEMKRRLVKRFEKDMEVKHEE